ncbi:GntR family transcriptional regulator [Kineosporia rhizophila]|uniref:GntR family transcriptional regulator n=1 Tax=Kineosporia TaxID=49184 RepID=UPI001E480A86|nr:MULTISPECIES: GntR family transcriptional regulator [Kineosporia]MCE0537544.1 GntR family transcriptional regulator [Kineosporia rhizophila]
MSPRKAGGSSRQAVYESLRRRILGLELPPGTALSENDLATEMGISRTPVRESMILLSEEGLVQVFPKVGTFVSRVDAARVADAQFLREAVELAALEDVPDEPDAELVALLRENLGRQQAAGIEREEFFRLDEEFHHLLLRLSGHGNSWSTVASAKGHLDRARRLGLDEVGSPKPFIDQHADVLEAVLSGNTEAARTTLRHHLRAVFEDVERVRRRSPELFATDPDAVPVRRSVAVWNN